MKKLAITACAVIIGSVGFGLSASAKPDKPLNAATAESGTGCIVRAGEADPYVGDAECSWHTVTKNDKDGNPVSFKYQDKGKLQAGQTAPAKAVNLDITLDLGFAAPCTGKETITPAGNYSSDLTCTN